MVSLKHYLFKMFGLNNKLINFTSHRNIIMGNICGPRKHDTIITSFSDPIIPIGKEQEVSGVNEEISMPMI